MFYTFNTSEFIKAKISIGPIELFTLSIHTNPVLYPLLQHTNIKNQLLFSQVCYKGLRKCKIEDKIQRELSYTRKQLANNEKIK